MLLGVSFQMHHKSASPLALLKSYGLFLFLTDVFGTSGVWCDCVWTTNKVCSFYVKVHEGRCAGLCNKIKAFMSTMHDQHSITTHVDALQATGYESDIHKYDTPVRFIKHKLQVKSIRLFTNTTQRRLKR